MKQCDDDNDGITSFNLKQSEILINKDDESLKYTYHLSEDNAIRDMEAIDDPTSFINIEANQIFVRVQNQLNCYSVVELNLEVSTTAIPSNFKIFIEECDNELIDGDDSNGITTFNFSSATNDILKLFPSNQPLIVTYYENMNDALALNNVINSDRYRNDNSPYSTKIVVRVDNKNNNACVGLGFHLELNTIPLPEFELNEHQFLCLDQLPNPILIYAENVQSSYTYEWKNSRGDILTTNNTSLLEITEAGDYFLTAINNFSCELTKRITIEESSIATIESIDIKDVSENNSISIHVSGEGNYEYTIDDIYGDYQDENYFEGIFGGKHIVFVRDKNNCGIESKSIAVLDIPKFFTPNGDGINDTWQIDGVYSQPNSKIYIFDKFGKLLKQIDALGNGWNGYYNGNPLPSTDYWYLAQLEDGRVYKGHFSLIRN